MFNFQNAVWVWVKECFGLAVAHDPVERRERFLEEALELAQACDMEKDAALRLVEYVYTRPAGEVHQEIAGVSVTLNALASERSINRTEVEEAELSRCYEKIEKIRDKQKTKPRMSEENTHYPEREWQYLPSDGSKWRVRGEEDPHGDYYRTRTREDLCGGFMSDDELANEVYLSPNIANLTSAKERIRWLTRQLHHHEEGLRQLKQNNKVST